ncbi:MAG: DUF2007 domain-containing protein [Saprospiraceae bacterium]|nr:DUF2007 domain-containing protein [Saprospiraceae bacterium]
MEGWTKVFIAADVLQAKLAEDALKQNGIESHIYRGPDPNFPAIGEAELIVPDDKAEAAIEVLQENGFIE